MLVLASNSPRRKQLLALSGWSFSIIPAEVDERPLVGEGPIAYVQRLAESKARAVAEQAPFGSIIIGADTTVVDRNQILGKPASPAEAEAMLRRLRGRTHEVYTALAVLRAEDGVLLNDLCSSEVRMRDYTDEEMAKYIASGDPMDKAGAYAIQHAVFNPVESLHGCFTNVVGLPLCRLVQTLAKLGLSLKANLPYACLYTKQDECSFTPKLLK